VAGAIARDGSGRDAGWASSRQHIVSFSGNAWIIVGSTLNEVGARGDIPPRDIRAAVVDTLTGQTVGTRLWPGVIRRKATLLATSDGSFLVRDAQALTLYSRSFEHMAEIALPDARPKAFEQWRVFVTPTGKHVVTAHVIGEEIQVNWLDPVTLRQERVWSLAPEMPRAEVFPELAVSDSSVLLVRSEHGKCQVSVQDGTTAWHPVVGYDKPCRFGAHFLGQDMLFLPLPQGFQVLGLDGHVAWQESLPDGEFVRLVRGSANGGRIAAPITAFQGGSSVLDISSHEVLKRINIYDIQSKTCFCRVEKNPGTIAGFALSPDGSKLLALRGSVMELYDLPAWPPR